MDSFIRFIKQSLSGPDKWNVLFELSQYFIVRGLIILCIAIAFLIIFIICFKYVLGYGVDFEFPLIAKILICFIIWLPIFLGVFCEDLVKSGFPLENKILCRLADMWRLIAILPILIATVVFIAALISIPF